ncbi:DUF1349 domain-containing protein [Lacibacter sp. MH-610]|uniref:DUF1349 domain-containing protein n=1 Tax=Lacibacter sp. MH-610 TaxID=3020883 RepID=UPI00389279F0
MMIFLIAGLSTTASANDSLRIATIPHALYWENKPLSYAIKGNTLTINAGAKTDMFRDPNVTYNTDNAPKLLFKTTEDFVLISKIEHAFTSKWDGGALVIKADSLNWVKFCFEKDYTGTRRIVSVVTKDISDDCNSVAMSSNTAWFKIAKAGNVITLYTSSNGNKWLLVRHFQFHPGEIQVGFLAQSPTGNSCRVLFSEITYKQKTISDPYKGE